MKKTLFLFIFFLLFISSILYSLPPIEDLRNALGRPVPTNAERVGAHQYAREISSSYDLVLNQEYFVRNGSVYQTVYAWTGRFKNDIEKIEWEIYDLLETLGRVERRGIYFSVTRNGYIYYLQPLEETESKSFYVQLTCAFAN